MGIMRKESSVLAVRFESQKSMNVTQNNQPALRTLRLQPTPSPLCRLASWLQRGKRGDKSPFGVVPILLSV